MTHATLRGLKLSAVLSAGTLLAGCTGLRVDVHGPGNAQRPAISRAAGTLHVKDNTPRPGWFTASTMGSVAIELSEGFPKELERCGIAGAVVATPPETTQPAELALSTHFSLTADTHIGQQWLYATLMTLSVFLLEPALWYRTDFVFYGRIDVHRDGAKIGVVKANTRVTVHHKYVSAQRRMLKGEDLEPVKRALYNEMLVGLKDLL